MQKQTAIEFLIETLKDKGLKSELDKLDHYVQLAKYMEREQVKNDYEKGQQSTGFKFPLDANAYYNETYKKIK
jgi:hypothetical protein